jgi:hypothetical protein
VRRLVALGAAALTAVGLAAGLYAPQAGAVPGQCFDTRWGGFCDSYPWADGSFQHCESFAGFSNCYQSCLDPAGRPYPTDLDPRTLCP